MRITFSDWQAHFERLDWSITEVADKLSAIGFETEVSNETLEVTILGNRKDCQDIRYLAYDFAAIYNLPLAATNISILPAKAVAVTLKEINHLLGTTVTTSQFQQLERLGFNVTSSTVTPPAFRTDIAEIADVAEEVIRLLGYETLHRVPLSQQSTAPSNEYSLPYQVKLGLQSLGATETSTYSFSSQGRLALKNPFRDNQPYLRASLQEGLLLTLAKNPFLKRAMFFELGQVFGEGEQTMVGVIAAGVKDPQTLEQGLSQILGTNVTLVEPDSGLKERSDAKQNRIYWCEVTLERCRPVAVKQPVPKQRTVYKQISKYPPLVRDVTVARSVADSEVIIKQAESKFSELLFAEIVDTFTAPETGEPKTTLRFYFQQLEHSFTEAEIDQLTEQLERWLEQ